MTNGDRKRRRLPYGLTLVIFSAQIGLGIILFAVFQEFVPNQLETGDAWAGFMLTSYGATRFAFETPTGAILDRIERKHGLLIGLVLMVPAIALMHLVRDEVAYLAFASALGLGTAFIWPASYSISADLYPSEQRGQVVGLLNVGQFLGFGLGALIGAILIEESAGVVFLIAGLTVLGAFLLALVAVPSYRHGREVHTERPGMWRIMSPPLVLMSLVIFAVTASTGLLLPAMRPFGEDELGVSFRTLTFILIPAIVIGAATYVPAGTIADRYGRTAPLYAGQVLMIAALIVIATTNSPWVAGFAAVPGFAGYTLSVPAYNATIMDLAPATHRGTVIGFSVALTGFGLATGPFIGGLIVQEAGAPAAFLTSASLFAIVLGIVFIYSRVARSHESAELARPDIVL